MSATELLSMKDVCERLKLGRSTVYRQIKAGRLESFTVGRSRRIPLEAVQKFVRELTAQKHG